jgi:hypothetical protein
MRQKVKHWIKSAPDRKVYIEVLTALLTVPVLITVLLTNFSNLTKTKDSAKNPEPSPKQEIIIKQLPDTSNAPKAEATSTTMTPQSCKKEVGPVTIAYPKEGDTISDNPLTISIKYDNDTYCSVVWSYRINGGPWSDYDSNSISLYNLPNGDKQLELRVQSTVTQDQDIITRNFTYTGSTAPAASSSAQ